MIIAVDFDGTLCHDEWPGIGAPNNMLIKFLKERKLRGDRLILWTCRSGRQLEEAVEWSASRGLLFDAVNDNVPETIKKYGGNSRKITCDYYIDDRAMTPDAYSLSAIGA